MKTDKTIQYYTKNNIDNIKNSIIVNANQMIDLNGKIDTLNLIDKTLIDNNPLTLLEDKEGNILNADKDNNYWLKEMDNYIDYLKSIANASLSNVSSDELKRLTIDFNKVFLTKYVSGINTNIIDLMDKKDNYANHLATALVDLQAIEILKIGITTFIDLDLNKSSDADFKQYMQTKTLKKLQELFKTTKIKLSNNMDTNAIKPLLYQVQIIDSIKQVETIIKENKSYYEDLHKKYETIHKLLDVVSNKYNERDKELSKYSNAVAPKQAQNKQINLHLTKIFNNTYPLNKYTSIDKNHNEKYDIKLKVSIDEEFKDLRDIIFVDDINKKQISLLPIDLALFIGFTSINNINGGNVPITLTDAFKYISEDKKMRIRKGQKARQLYDDKMQLFKSFKVSSIIKDRDTNDTLIEFKDAIPILENYKVEIKSRKDEGYIIGASAILSILNFLAEQEGLDYTTTFSTANNYINDSQSNTIAILNMKYYLIIKILQMGNASKNSKVFNPHINLNDLYSQTALLNGKDELSKTEKQRLRGQMEIFLNHLKSNNLLKEYDYTPFKEIATKESNKLAKVSKNDLYIKL